MSDMSMLSESKVAFEAPDPTVFIVGCSVLSMVWAVLQYRKIAETNLEELITNNSIHERSALKESTGPSTARQLEVLKEVYEAVRVGANSFLRAEYTICVQFVVGFSALIVCLIGWYVSHLSPIFLPPLLCTKVVYFLAALC